VQNNLIESKLSRRELDCLFLLAKGYKRKEVAEELSVKITTIHTFISRIKNKLSSHTLQKALNQAREKKIID
jgi:DNA-binding NarL/FixJ family response regulator